MLECRKHSLHSCMIPSLYYTKNVLYDEKDRIVMRTIIYYCLLLKLKLIISRNLFYVDLNITFSVLSTSEPFNILRSIYCESPEDTISLTRLRDPIER